MGKAKNLVDVEKFLAGQQGVDMSESKAKKQTVAGKKVQSVTAAASTNANLVGARGAARAAMKAGRGDEEDESAGGSGPKSPNTAVL